MTPHKIGCKFGRQPGHLVLISARWRAWSLNDWVEEVPGFLRMADYADQFDREAPTLRRLRQNASRLPWIALAQSHRQWPPSLMQLMIIHGDCKINNVLFDQQGERVLAVIDLDNNMSGHWAWDFGDLVRSVTFSRGGFDAQDYRACVALGQRWSWFRRSRG